MPYAVGPIIFAALVLLWLVRGVYRGFNPHGRERAQLKRTFRSSWATHLSDCDECFEAPVPLLTHAETVLNEAETALLANGTIANSGLMEPGPLVDYVESVEKLERVKKRVASAAGLLAVVALVVVPITLGVVLNGGEEDAGSSSDAVRDLDPDTAPFFSEYDDPRERCTYYDSATGECTIRPYSVPASGATEYDDPREVCTYYDEASDECIIRLR